MARARVRDLQADFRGGLNLSFDDDALAPNEVRRADESVLTEFGAITKRLGTQRLSDGPIGDTVFVFAVGGSLSAAVFARTGDATYVEDV
jgi:hypothetical protein